MEYTVKQLADMAGVSGRTLRYYDEVGILRPARISASGYRMYGPPEVDQLQQILFFRELGFRLEEIHTLVTSPSFEHAAALRMHRKRLLDKRRQIDALIKNVETTIAMTEGKMNMTDAEKFEGFKQGLIEENERKYGKEVRDKFGDAVVDASNHKVLGLTPSDYDKVTQLEEDFRSTLAEAMRLGDPACERAQKAAEMHKAWLMHFWGEYKKEAHTGLAETYVEDERFRVYYDRDMPGTAAFLRDAIRIYTGIDK